MAEALYVHIPFCDSICAYCDFARVLTKSSLVDEYLVALEKEVLSKDLSNLKTIYIGGGTPSALSSDQLKVLFEILKPYANELVEYTIEINPETLTKEKAEVMREYNINRASLGMQVTQQHLLKLIERNHTVEEVQASINLLKSVGITNISIDLMYGIPTQTLEDLKESIAQIVKFDTTHVSIYGLTIEDFSKLGRLGYEPAEAELDANMFELSLSELRKNGFERYEIANFAKVGYESVHNKYYWRYDDFVAVGLHASGKENDIRYTNTRHLRKYINGENEREVIELSEEDKMFEFIMMNLRMRDGFKLKRYTELFNVDFLEYYKDEVNELLSMKLIEVNDESIYATDQGLELLFEVLEKFMRW